MSTDSTITAPAGGFAGDPFAALNPPTASGSGCCSSAEATDATSCCATPAGSAGDGCRQTNASQAESAGCC